MADCVLQKRYKRASVILFTALLFLANLGCKEPPVWTAEAHSPDGLWTATAKTFVYSGFGTGGVETIVEIKKSRQSPEQVLAFAEGGQDAQYPVGQFAPSCSELSRCRRTALLPSGQDFRRRHFRSEFFIHERFPSLGATINVANC